jgi:hypothetical protein
MTEECKPNVVYSKIYNGSVQCTNFLPLMLPGISQFTVLFGTGSTFAGTGETSAGTGEAEDEAGYQGRG